MPPASSLPPSHLSSSPIAASPRKNRLALVSLVLGALAPTVALVALVAGLAHASALATFLAGVLGLWTAPMGLAAVVCGHIALIQAKRYPRAQAWRAVALTGLVLGYGALAAFVVFIVYILATFH